MGLLEMFLNSKRIQNCNLHSRINSKCILTLSSLIRGTESSGIFIIFCSSQCMFSRSVYKLKNAIFSNTINSGNQDKQWMSRLGQTYYSLQSGNFDKQWISHLGQTHYSLQSGNFHKQWMSHLGQTYSSLQSGKFE